MITYTLTFGIPQKHNRLTKFAPNWNRETSLSKTGCRAVIWYTSKFGSDQPLPELQIALDGWYKCTLHSLCAFSVHTCPRSPYYLIFWFHLRKEHWVTSSTFGKLVILLSAPTAESPLPLNPVEHWPSAPMESLMNDCKYWGRLYRGESPPLLTTFSCVIVLTEGRQNSFVPLKFLSLILLPRGQNIMTKTTMIDVHG